MNNVKGPCDTIRDCVEAISTSVEQLCKEKAEISQQLKETSEKLRGAQQFLPSNTPPTVNRIVDKAIHTVDEIARGIKGAGGLTTNFSTQAGRNTGPLGKMNLKRGQFQTGLGGASVMASSAEIGPSAPVGGKWTRKMSTTQKKPYWISSEGQSSWVKPVNAEITQAAGRRKQTRRTRKSRSKSRKSRR
jgi:hypothetical protein